MFDPESSHDLSSAAVNIFVKQLFLFIFSFHLFVKFLSYLLSGGIIYDKNNW